MIRAMCLILCRYATQPDDVACVVQFESSDPIAFLSDNRIQWMVHYSLYNETALKL